MGMKKKGEEGREKRERILLVAGEEKNRVAGRGRGGGGGEKR